MDASKIVRSERQGLIRSKNQRPEGPHGCPQIFGGTERSRFCPAISRSATTTGLSRFAESTRVDALRKLARLSTTAASDNSKRLSMVEQTGLQQ